MKLVGTLSAFLFEIPVPGKQSWSPQDFFFLRIWKLMKYIGICVCDIPGKKIFIKNYYCYLKYTCLGGHFISSDNLQ